MAAALSAARTAAASPFRASPRPLAACASSRSIRGSLAWKEESTEGSDADAYYTMVVSTDGTIAQPKTELDPQYRFTRGDDFEVRTDGGIVWANDDGGRLNVVTLTPQ